jgi:PhzF family phenazine biosynthesis protein
MQLDLYRVDAFADRPFGGNPAAVCLLPEPRATEWMQSVAREMNQPVTAFLQSVEEGQWRLQWFTPAVELELCGHATLASAHVLWEEAGRLSPGEPARFHTRSGLLTAERRDGLIEMDFPARATAAAEAPDGLVEALGVTPRFVGENRTGHLVEVSSEEDVRSARPDYEHLRALQARVILTAASSGHPYDFISRFFAPGIGIDEDSVTGSSHCALGPFWAERTGRTSFLAWQASERGGAVRVRVEGDRVKLGGQAVTVLRGQLVV